MTAKDKQLVISDFNLEKLNTKQLQDHIRASIQAGSNMAIFGRRGVGKTQISKQVIEEQKLIEVYMNLSVFERVDLGGYPDMLSPKEKQERFVNYILPRMYEPMIYGDVKVVALLDEVDKADPSLWAPLLEFTNLQSINGRKLPMLQCCIMTGNLIAEGGTRPSLPLLDRTEKYLVEAGAIHWLEWAASVPHIIHPAVYRFISDNHDSLMGSVDSSDYYADESPRGWTLASKVLFFGEANGWNMDMLLEKVSGYVGKKSGGQFKLYLTGYKTLLPMIDKIFAGEEYVETWNMLTPTEKLYACSIVCGRLAAQLDAAAAAKSNEAPPSISRVGKFLQRCSFENVLLSVRQQLLVKRIVRWKLDEHPDWQSVLVEMKSTVQGTVDSMKAQLQRK